jgi:DegV family protein with EDD domain
MQNNLTKDDLKRMIICSYERIEKEKEKINKINVFPVPDQDTGGNLAKTLQGIKNVIENKDFPDLETFSDAVLDGALESAQGNAGIIYTGFLVGFLSSLRNHNPIAPQALALAMKQGAIRARNSIQDPREGTILDVIDAASEAIGQNEKENDIVSILKKAVEKAEDALLATREKMEIFKKANVVDAGGLGYLMILESYVDALEGKAQTESKERASEDVKRFVQKLSYRYEVVFLILNKNVKKMNKEELFSKLSEVGDSIEVLEVGDKTKVHVHTDDPDQVKKIAREAGEVQNLRTEDMAKEVAGEESIKETHITLVADETCDIPQKIVEKYQIEVVPQVINWDEGEKLLGENIYEKLKEADKKGIKTLPKTSQASPKVFLDAFKKKLDTLPKDGQIITILLSSKLSGAFNSAMQARQMVSEPNRIHIIDSMNVSSGLGVIILDAIELIQEQTPLEEIESKIKDTETNFFAALDDPKWLENGGRLSHSQAKWIRRLSKIGIRPLLTIKEGKIEKGGIVFGSKDIATAIFKKIKSSSAKAREEGKIRVVINHCDNEEEAQKLKDKLKEIKVEVAYSSLVSPVIGVHVGPGAVIAAWSKINK